MTYLLILLTNHWLVLYHRLLKLYRLSHTKLPMLERKTLNSQALAFWNCLWLVKYRRWCLDKKFVWQRVGYLCSAKHPRFVTSNIIGQQSTADAQKHKLVNLLLFGSWTKLENYALSMLGVTLQCSLSLGPIKFLILSRCWRIGNLSWPNMSNNQWN